VLSFNSNQIDQAKAVVDLARKIYARKKRDIDLPPEVWKRYPDDPIRFCTRVLKQLREESWWGWKVIIKAARAMPLQDDELVFFRKVAQRDPPTRPVREMWLVVGRRGGKDSIASMLALEAARFADKHVKFRPGEHAIIPCIAQDRDHASIVFNYIKGYFEEYPELKGWLGDDLPNTYRSGGIVLNNRTEVRVTTNNFRAPRGFPVPFAVLDEVAFWRDESSATPDVETYRALRPGMNMFQNSMLVGISTPYMKKGLLYSKYQEAFGKNDPRVLVIQAETLLLHPNIDREEMEEDFQNDPEAANAEWHALFREDLADFVSPETIQAITITDRTELPYVYEIGNYFAFCDPSGGNRDSFTLAIAHRDETNGKGVLDFITEHRAPFRPSDVVKVLAQDLRRYNISAVTGDNYAGEWPKEAFDKEGIIYEQSELNKSGIYKEALSLFNSREVELLDIRRLFSQITSLERRTVRGGRDSIDHPPKLLDDVANAVCGALVGVTLGWGNMDVWARLAS
jgi:hypothetical protein